MKKSFSMLLALVLVLGLVIPTWSQPVSAAEKAEIKRTIAIVFDNSGSMYNGDADRSKAWCRATYAMEAFATMMNAGDTMMIYPMHAIEVDGVTYTSDDPLIITQETASKIERIYSISPDVTPIETIEAAYADLEAMSGTEEWLIVLTDGTEFYRNGNMLSASASKSELEKTLTLCAKTINTMYLGIGANAIEPKPNGYYVSSAKSSKDVLARLSEMCNMIFGRNQLKNVVNEVTFDVSMSKVILFLQGAGVSDVSLSGATASLVDSLKYSTKGGGGVYATYFQVDTTLQGVMVTFENLEAGTYTLSYSGTATSVTAYYEPDVDIFAQLQDANGNVVDPNSTLTEGDYSIVYEMVDKNGNPTTSALLDPLQYTITYTINDEETVIKTNEAGKVDITLHANDVLDVDFRATYLEGYSIHKTAADFGWPSLGIQFAPIPAGELVVQINGASSHNLSQFGGGTIYRIALSCEGETITGEALDRVDISAQVSGGNCTYELLRDNEGYYVQILPPDALYETQDGDYTISVTAQYTKENTAQTQQVTKRLTYTLVDDSSALSMTLDVPQNYYQLSKLAEGKPIVLRLTLGGQPLTDAQLDQVNLTWDTENLQVTVTPLYGQSAYEVRIVNDPEPETAAYKLNFVATTRNELGKDVTSGGATKVQIRLLPQWLRILLPILIILLIILIILFIMTRKVLPKKLRVIDTEFYVDGETIPGAAGRIKYSGGGKRKGNFTITSPDSADPNAYVGVKVTVEAASCRYVPHKQRRMKVVNVTPVGSSIRSYGLGSGSFDYDYLSGKYIAAGSSSEDPFRPYEIGGTTDVNVFKSQDDGYSVNFDCKIVPGK